MIVEKIQQERRQRYMYRSKDTINTKQRIYDKVEEIVRAYIGRMV